MLTIPTLRFWKACDNAQCRIQWFHEICISDHGQLLDNDDEDDNLINPTTDDNIDEPDQLEDDFARDRVAEDIEIECVDAEEDDELLEHTSSTTRKKRTLWYCSFSCLKTTFDKKFLYSKAVLFSGLQFEAFRDAIRENDGPRIVTHLKLALIQFINGRHPIYKQILTETLSRIGGHSAEHIRHDLLWNGLVNVKGGAGNNLESDLFNEFLIREVKKHLGGAGNNLESDLFNEFLIREVKKHLISLKGNISDELLEKKTRCIGITKEVFADINTYMLDDIKSTPRTANRTNWRKDIPMAVKDILNGNCLTEVGPRYHMGFNKLFLKDHYVSDLKEYGAKIQVVCAAQDIDIEIQNFKTPNTVEIIDENQA